jgi:hypothetical protein
MNCGNIVALIVVSMIGCLAILAAIVKGLVQKFLSLEIGFNIGNILILGIGILIILLLSFAIAVSIIGEFPVCSRSLPDNLLVILTTPTLSAPNPSTDTPVPSATSPAIVEPTQTPASIPLPTATSTIQPTETPITPVSTSTSIPEPPICCLAPLITSTIGYHQLMRGETIYCIGRGYGVLPSAIAEANNLKPDMLIHRGLILRIPRVQWVNIPPGPVCSTQFESPFPGL